MERIRLADPDTENGLAQMLATLLQQNVEERPSKKALLTSMKRRTFTIIGSDMGLIVSLVFSRRGLVIHDGVVGVPHVVIITDSETLLDLARLRILFGRAPVVWDGIGRSMLDKLRSGDLVIKGALLYLRDFGRFGQLMSVNS